MGVQHWPHASASCLLLSDRKRQEGMHLTWNLELGETWPLSRVTLMMSLLGATFAGVLYSGGWEGG